MGGDGEIADFAMLIEYVAEIPGIERIRYTTSHPREMTPAPDRRLRRGSTSWSRTCTCRCSRGSDRVLAAMKRGYTALEYKSIVRRLRAARPDLSLTSDFIVGFPGETDADFERDAEARRGRRLRRRVQLRLQPAPRHAGGRAAPTRCRPRSSSSGSSGCNARARRAVPRATATRWSAAASGCWSPGRAVKNAAELQARTENNRVVNFAGDAALIGRYVDVDDHRRAAALAARRTRRCARRRGRLNARRAARSNSARRNFQSLLHARRHAPPVLGAVPPRFALALLAAALGGGCATLADPGSDGAGTPGAAATPPRLPPSPLPRRPRWRRRSSRRRRPRPAPARRLRRPRRLLRPRRRRASRAPFADVIKDAKETAGSLPRVAEGRQGLARDRARAVRPAVSFPDEPRAAASASSGVYGGMMGAEPHRRDSARSAPTSS